MKNLNLRTENEIAILEFDQPDSKVNVLNTETMSELAAALDEIKKRQRGLKALIIKSKKDGIFIAGADIKEIEHINSAKEAEQKAEDGKKILNSLNDPDLITVAAINGACLGGGFELALACKYRTAAFGDKVRIGLPEVKLGIIPGFGGTVRLPALIGLARALNMILSGRMLSGRDALKYGAVDRLFPESRLEEENVGFVRGLLDGSEKVKRQQKKKFSEIFLEKTPLGRKIIFSQAKKNVLKQTRGFYQAPLKALDVIERGCGKRAADGFRMESEAFGGLAVTEISKNLIKVFYLAEKFKKFQWVDKDIKPAAVKKCGILGAGVMGGGIAQLVSFKDIPVRVRDISHGALKKALETAYGLFESAVKKRKLKKHEAEYKFAMISPTLNYKGFENADMVVEAVVESLEIKQKVFEEVSRIVAPKAVIVSNTSSLQITKIAESAISPERTAGLHFFNPVHRMPLVEVIRSDKTNEETLASVIAFARKLGKTVIVVKDVPGFLINRILLSYLNEAGFLIEEGVTIGRLDRIALDFGMPMGPAELIDEIGIDVGYKVAKILEESYGGRMRVPQVLKKISNNGLLGRKSGRGFYIHKGKKKIPNSEVYKITGCPGGGSISDEDALKRMVYVMVNEAARCLQEKVADSPEVVDVGMIMGTGFPPFRAGLLRYADSVGLKKIVGDLDGFEKRHKTGRFKPCDYIVEKSEKEENFYRRRQV